LGVQAQNEPTFTLNKALDYAETNNLYVRALERKKQGMKALVGTAWELPQTQLEYQRGQVQFFPIDYTFVISQSFQLPGVYNRQKDLLEVQAEQSTVQINLLKRELKRDIRLLFAGHFLAQSRLKQLAHQDSVFKQAKQIASQRVAIGESDKLLLQSLENQILQLEVEAEQFRNQAKLVALGLQQLLSLKEVPLMQSEALVSTLNPAKTESHPWLEMALQDKKLAENQLRLDKARWWPTVSLGYVNQSVERNRNLQYGMAGLSVPLFVAPYKARQKASASLIEQKALEVDASLLALQNRLEISKIKVDNLQMRLKQFENNILKQARQNETLARRRWQLGQLDYFQFLLIVQQGWQAERQALDLTEQWQQALAELNFFQGD
jgi:cobalt-zinc-cadmium resistance protein CzcA